MLTDANPDKARYRQLLDDLGRETLSALFPSDFEAYFISLELVDSDNNTEAFLTFPVQPDSISEVATKITNIKQTAGGVVAIGTNTFVPIDIEVKGNFGRNLKFMLGNKFVQGGLISFARSDKNITEFGRPAFSSEAKTGYGVIKALESIINSADSLDEKGKSKRLYFYNTILGNNYIVKPKNFIHSQNVSQNMIPQYTLQFTAVAPLDQSTFGEIFKLGKSLTISSLNKEIEAISKTIKGVLGL